MSWRYGYTDTYIISMWTGNKTSQSLCEAVAFHSGIDLLWDWDEETAKGLCRHLIIISVYAKDYSYQPNSSLSCQVRMWILELNMCYNMWSKSQVNHETVSILELFRSLSSICDDIMRPFNRISSRRSRHLFLFCFSATKEKKQQHINKWTFLTSTA